MRVLVVGSGGREHALAWKISQSPLVRAVFAAPGNPGIAEVATLVPLAAHDVAGIAGWARSNAIDLVVVGPEAPLVAGLVDRLAGDGIPAFGPSAAAAEIEGSKAFAKRLMREAGVPTAAFGTFTDADAAAAFIDAQPGLVVVKADGLAAGKGVVVAATKDEAKAAARRMLEARAFGDAGAQVVIEERLSGREVTMMAICDGTRLALLASSEDHKAVGDGDVGPNTGGMGTVSPSTLVDDALAQQMLETLFVPTVRALTEMGRPFRGLLYGGFMLTPDRGPMVIEWNCRFGDPETQSVLMRMDGDLVPWLAGAAAGAMPAGVPRARSGVAVCVALAAGGYPGTPRLGDEITRLPASTSDLVVFHAGTRRDSDGRLVTAGGRVLGVTAYGADLAAARARAYAAVEDITFDGKHFRRDIGMRGKT